MKKQKIPIHWASASKSGRSTKANGSRLINLFAEALPSDSKSPMVLHGTTGSEFFAELPSLPVLGLHVMQGELFAVTREHLCKISRTGKVETLGELYISSIVSMADNGTDLVFVDGWRGYTHNKTDGLKRLSGSGWYPANSVTYQDGYFIFNRKGTGQFFISDLLSTEFSPLEFATAEGAPGDTVKVISSRRQLWLLGEHTVEHWWNRGVGSPPFDRVQGAFIERGCIAPDSVAKTDTAVIWLGDDRVFYLSAGEGLNRISTHAVEFDLKDGEVSDAQAFVYSEEGHQFYVCTFPHLNKTWCFDVATGLWHERQTEDGRHLANSHAVFNGDNIVGDYRNGKLYRLSMDTFKDGDAFIKRTAISPPVHAGRNKATVWNLELDMESGVGLFDPDAYGHDPQAMLSWSNDGGNTWSNQHWKPIGKDAQFLTRVRWSRLGSFRQRHFKLEILDPVPVSILGATAEVSYGAH